MKYEHSLFLSNLCTFSRAIIEINFRTKDNGKILVCAFALFALFALLPFYPFALLPFCPFALFALFALLLF